MDGEIFGFTKIYNLITSYFFACRKRTAAGIIQNKISVWKKYTVCSKSSDPFYVVTYYIKWVTTSWTYSIDTFWVCYMDIQTESGSDLFQK